MSLRGKTVLLTRDRSDDIEAEIVRRGGRAISAPMIKISAPDSWDACDAALGKIASYNALVFTSVNGVQGFFGHCNSVGVHRNTLAHLDVYAVGEKTKEALEQHAIRVTATPEDFSSTSLAEYLKRIGIHGKSLLHPCGNLAGSELAQRLVAAGAIVETVIVYKTDAPDPEKVQVAFELLKVGCIDVVTFASPSAVRNYARTFGREKPRATVAVIGSTTAQAVHECGWDVGITAHKSTMSDMVDAIETFFD